MRWLSRQQRAQTILEYVLMVAAFALPLAYTVRELLRDSEEDAKDNIMRRVTADAYGDDDQFGVIGRPYP